MDLNFTYSDNNSPNFAGIFSRVYERISDRSRAKSENDAHAQSTQRSAESMQKSTSNTVQTFEYQGIDSKKKPPLSEDWQMVGQPRQFGRTPTSIRPGQPSESRYPAPKPARRTPTSLRPGVRATYPQPPQAPKKPRAPRTPSVKVDVKVEQPKSPQQKAAETRRRNREAAAQAQPPKS